MNRSLSEHSPTLALLILDAFFLQMVGNKAGIYTEVMNFVANMRTQAKESYPRALDEMEHRLEFPSQFFHDRIFICFLYKNKILEEQ